MGGDGLNTGTEFGQGSRLPRQSAWRFQTGFNFELNPSINLFGEAKYVEETNFDQGQPTFFQLAITDLVPSTLAGSSAFTLQTDNAFLNRDNPDLVQAIRNNTRPVYAAPTAEAPGEQIGVAADPRALLGLFGPSRSQLNNRELQRYVIGADGRFDDLGFFRNNTWEVSYTYGEMNNSNRERGVDSERFFYASDAVFDVNNVLGGGTDNIVCRVQIQAALDGSIPNAPAIGGIGRIDGATIPGNDPAITGCTPISLFGTDFRADADHPEATGGGGRQGLTSAQEDYLLAEIEVTNTNRQHNFLAFASTETWDFWGAGPIGFAGGYEYRKEETEGTGRDRDTAGRLLFLNTGPDFETADYTVNEVFGEVRVPLLDNQLFMDSAEVSAAYRYSDYSTVGSVETYSFQAQVRPVEDLFLRATYGEAIRIPNLGENFAPATQTFGNNLVDPCSPQGIRGRSNLTAAERDQLRANCLATMPAGYNPGSDDPNSGSPGIIQYSSGIPGFNAGNPDLQPEESTSYTFGFAVTPRWVEGFSFTADYYNIEISNVIATVSIQQAMNQCVGLLGDDVGSVNQAACNTFQRSATQQIAQQPPFGIFTFTQGSLNYASFETQGIDFTAGYGYDLGRFGYLNWSLRGNYLIANDQFTNISDPTDKTARDDLIGFPRWRTRSTLGFSPVDNLTLSWTWDWQSSQEIVDSDDFETNMDRFDLRFYRTDAFSQHDFVVSYSPTDRVRLRGGVVNAFDAEPARWLGSTTAADNFDFWGRRFFVGINARY